MTFKELRHKMGFTVTQCSKVFGIPYSTLQKWEHGYTKPADYVLTMMWDLYQYRKSDIASMLKG